jgi:hypothetical protein
LLVAVVVVITLGVVAVLADTVQVHFLNFQVEEQQVQKDLVLKLVFLTA